MDAASITDRCAWLNSARRSRTVSANDAQGQHPQQPLSLKVVAQVLDQGDAVRIRPVQVFQDDHQALGGQAPEKLDHRLAPDAR
jgi:hypothetical protein